MSRLPKKKMTADEVYSKLKVEIEEAKRKLSEGRKMVLAHHIHQGEYCLDGALRHLGYAGQLLKLFSNPLFSEGGKHPTRKRKTADGVGEGKGGMKNGY
jgi:hypothetical protein